MNSECREAKRPAHEIQGVILDYGEVLCRRPGAEKMARMAGALGMDGERFAHRYREERGPYDGGELTGGEYWSRVAAARVEDGVLGKLRRWDMEMWSEVDGEMIAWLERVRAAGFKTALLSNMHPDMASHVRRTFGWLRDLDCRILSCEVRLIKPSPLIYERCLEGLGLQAREVLFIDDREANVRAAAALGMLALRFESAGVLRRELAGLGFPVLPARDE